MSKQRATAFKKETAKEREDKEKEEARQKLQEELRAKVIAEQNEKDPILNYVEELQAVKIRDPLKFQKIEFEPEEWSNIPKLVARFCLMLTKQLQSIVEYSQKRSGEETTLSVRKYATTEFMRVDEQYQKFKEEATRRIDTGVLQRNDLQKFTERVDRDLSLFKNYCDDMKLEKVQHLFDQAKEEDMINDNEQSYENDVKKYNLMLRIAKDDVLIFRKEDPIPATASVDSQEEDPSKSQDIATIPDESKEESKDEGGKVVKQPKFMKPKVKTYLPTSTENALTKARTFSFEQLYDFNNLFLNKSFLRKRVRSSEEDIFKAQNNIKNLFEWKKELTDLRAEASRAIYEKFDQIDQRHEKFVQEINQRNQNNENRISTNDAQISNIFVMIQENNNEIRDLKIEDEKLQKNIEENFQLNEKNLAEKYKKLLDKQNYAEKETNQSLSLLSKEIEKLKYELSDIIDQKFEHINRNLEKETKTLRSTYDELSSSLNKTNTDIMVNYKEKMIQLQSMIATFFAKTDKIIVENTKKTKEISVAFDQFQANFVNPSKEIDGKIFTMNMKIDSSEQMRESQFAVLKDTVKKLIVALETQNLSYAQHQSFTNMQLMAESQQNSLLKLDRQQSGQMPLYGVASVQQLANDFLPGNSQEKIGDTIPDENQDLHLPKIKDSLYSVTFANKKSSSQMAKQANQSIQIGGTSHPFSSHKHSINLLQTQNLPFEQFNELSPAAMSVLHESQVFQRRLNNISKKLDEDVEPFKPVSKDHLRTNKNGVNLDKLNPFRKERKSFDLAASKSIKGNSVVKQHLSHRKISRQDPAEDFTSQTIQPPASRNINYSITQSLGQNSPGISNNYLSRPTLLLDSKQEMRSPMANFDAFTIQQSPQSNMIQKEVNIDDYVEKDKQININNFNKGKVVNDFHQLLPVTEFEKQQKKNVQNKKKKNLAKMHDSTGMQSHINPLLTQGTMMHGNLDISSAGPNDSVYYNDNIKVQIGSEDIKGQTGDFADGPMKEIDQTISMKKKQLEESLKKK